MDYAASRRKVQRVDALRGGRGTTERALRSSFILRLLSRSPREQAIRRTRIVQQRGMKSSRAVAARYVARTNDAIKINK